MQSENSSNNQKKPERSFIEAARRAQIIEGTIESLADYGYVNLSFARIAKHIGISASLIPYHFKDKQDLLLEVMQFIGSERIGRMQKSIEGLITATDKLTTVIEADLAYMGTHPKLFQAMVEVTFNIRNETGKMTYLGDQDDPAVTLLSTILADGQAKGEFAQFNTHHVALILDAARDTFLAQLPLRPSLNLEDFTKTLTLLAISIAKKGL